ncbi:hypothetical protein SPRG_05492 [Saprolegnia parasitica CBS 223.65]|uniref:BZIP domain-containing protein n=1 Tax=Saprolegnia parasitica (strain CBS 223.65) TaxID=695850 RepID=A0A067CSM0_SAPPC|nr:hypothetical protein SPRG_05492 [Saprolegnia parasitica CBS 223.65]KDO29536.1 hypothetical protein SPRG_05492 [Saprolegnia parasitica CBS 223.65]|eukprot:XP_012199601.1 hypothetical protein SPRG_05492 [Saprolegnia parasitica CBS 223.65]
MPSKYKTPDAIARRRQQSRNNQRRYRQETRSYLQSLQSDVQALLHSTFRLEGQVDMMRQTVQRRFANDVARVGAYWRLFMCGYVAAPDQDAALRDLMADDVELREATGIDALFDQWRQYAGAFAFFRKELRSIEAVALDSDEHLVCVVGTVSLGLSDAAVATLWPHLHNTPDSRIRRRLADQTLTCPCTQLLYMRPSGDASAKVRRIEFEWDIAAGLATLLTDLDDVATVLHDRHQVFP